MRILVCPCSYKGTISALELAQAIAEVLAEKGHSSELAPFADGGDDTLACLQQVRGGEFVYKEVSGPTGIKGLSRYLKFPDHAVVELAGASGIALLQEGQFDPLGAQTEGFGQLIRFAIEAGARQIFLTVGGSASTDGGTGALRMLGARFLDGDGFDIAAGGAALLSLSRIDLAELKTLTRGCSFTVISDVHNPLTGPDGAASVFAPQKGANAAEVALLDRALAHFADCLEAALGRRGRDLPGAGSAGGAGFGLSMVLDAPIVSGFDWLSQELHLPEKLERCQAVVVAEGRIDSQSLSGKSVGRLIELARRRGCLVYGLPALVEPGLSAEKLGMTALTSVAEPGKTAGLKEVREKAAMLLPDAID